MTTLSHQTHDCTPIDESPIYAESKDVVVRRGRGPDKIQRSRAPDKKKRKTRQSKYGTPEEAKEAWRKMRLVHYYTKEKHRKALIAKEHVIESKKRAAQVRARNAQIDDILYKLKYELRENTAVCSEFLASNILNIDLTNAVAYLKPKGGKNVRYPKRDQSPTVSP